MNILRKIPSLTPCQQRTGGKPAWDHGATQDMLLLLEASVGSVSSSFESRGEMKSPWGAVWLLSWVFAFPIDRSVP